MNDMNAEWEAWQNVVAEFSQIGDIDKPQYAALVKAIALWGEHLVALRLSQTDEARNAAMAMAADQYEKVEREDLPKSLNPVTFRGSPYRGSAEEVALTMGRLHFASADRSKVPDGFHRLKAPQKLEKLVSCVLWKGNSEMQKRLGEMIMEEDHFVRGMKLLFPESEK